VERASWTSRWEEKEVKRMGGVMLLFGKLGVFGREGRRRGSIPHERGKGVTRKPHLLPIPGHFSLRVILDLPKKTHLRDDSCGGEGGWSCRWLVGGGGGGGGKGGGCGGGGGGGSWVCGGWGGVCGCGVVSRKKEEKA